LVALTSSEALEWGFSDGTVADLDELLAEIGFEGASVQQISQTWSETLVRVLTEPIIASLLFSIGSLLIIVDIFSGELSPLSAIGVGSLALFFWGHFLAGLAGLEGILLVLLGLALIMVEIFIIPGFGVFGVLGIVALGVGLFLSLTGEIVLESDLRRVIMMVGGAMVIILFGIVLMFIFLPAMGRFRGLVLQTRLGEDEPPPPPPRVKRWFGTAEPATEPDVPATPPREERPSLVGARGRALSDLRPGGFARINDQRVDVVTQGDYIYAGDLVEVVADDRYRRVVIRIEEDEQSEDDSADE
jgi:membrane-bound serine protease (ClpP class)